jgi:DNA-binding CsgD family transcriptional regulator
MDLLAPERLSQFIGAIYDCVVEPDGWPETMRQICLEIDGRNAGIHLCHLEIGRMEVFKQWNNDPQWQALYGEHPEDAASLYRSAPNTFSQSIDEPLVLSRDVPREIWMKTRLYQEWAKPQGLVDSVQSIVLRHPDRIGVLAVNRHESVGPATDRDIAVVRLLAPHIRRAVTISDLMDLKAFQRQVLGTTLDHVSTGVIIVAEGCRILHANDAARRMLDAGDPIRAVAGRLSVRNRQAEDELTKAIALARGNETGIGAAGIGVALQSAPGEAVVAHVLPLARGDLRTRLMPQATAAIFVTRAGMRPPASLPAVAASFGLTPAETRLLEHLARGATLGEAGAALDIAESTAKTHLSRIFAKTGASRQTDLVALVNRLAPPVHR